MKHEALSTADICFGEIAIKANVIAQTLSVKLVEIKHLVRHEKKGKPLENVPFYSCPRVDW